MTTAAAVLVCALDLLHRSAESLPRIMFLDERPAGASISAEAFADPVTRTIYILTTSEVFRAAQQSPTRCGNLQSVRKLASIIIHEEWHVLNGPDEEGAYAAQLIALTMLGAADTPLYNGVRRARDAVMAGKERAARVVSLAMR